MMVPHIRLDRRQFYLFEGLGINSLVIVHAREIPDVVRNVSSVRIISLDVNVRIVEEREPGYFLTIKIQAKPDQAIGFGTLFDSSVRVGKHVGIPFWRDGNSAICQIIFPGFRRHKIAGLIVRGSGCSCANLQKAREHADREESFPQQRDCTGPCHFTSYSNGEHLFGMSHHPAG